MAGVTSTPMMVDRCDTIPAMDYELNNTRASQLEKALAVEEFLEDAACQGTDPDPFYADHETAEIAKALTFCRKCEVVDQCLDYALRYNEIYGVWGGKTPKERKRIRRQRRIKDAQRRQPNDSALRRSRDQGDNPDAG